MATIGEIAVNVVARTGGLAAGLSSASKSFASFGEKASMVAGGIISAFAGLAAINQSFGSLLRVGSELDDMSQRTGIAVEELSALKHAAEQSDASLEDLQRGVIVLNKQLAAGKASKQFSDALERMGLSVQKLAGKSGDQQLAMIADGLQRIQDDGQRSAAALAIFGKSGVGLLPMLQTGSKQLGEFAKEAESLGLIMSGETAASAAAFDDQLQSLTKSLQAIGMQTAAVFLPVLNKIASVMLSMSPVTKTVAIGFGATVLAFSALVLIVPRAISAIGQIIKALRQMAAALAVVQATQGPKGIATLVAGLAASAAAVAYIGYQFDSVESSMAKLVSTNAEVAASYQNVDRAAAAAATSGVKFAKLRTTDAEKFAAERERVNRAAIAAGFAPEAPSVTITSRAIGSQPAAPALSFEAMLLEIQASNEHLRGIEENTRNGVEINEVSL
jgi:hypothetical protein